MVQAVCPSDGPCGVEIQSIEELFGQIWDGLPEHVSSDEVPEWHLAEIAKRREEADASPRAGKPWRKALSRFGGEA